MADTPEPVTPPQSVDPNKPAPIQKKDEPQLKTQEAKQPAPNVVTQQPQAQQQTSNTSDVGTTMSLSVSDSHMCFMFILSLSVVWCVRLLFLLSSLLFR